MFIRSSYSMLEHGASAAAEQVHPVLESLFADEPLEEAKSSCRPQWPYLAAL